MIKNIKKEIELIKAKDPSVKTNIEAMLHPTFKIMMYYKLSHYFYKKKKYTIARFIQNIGK